MIFIFILFFNTWLLAARFFSSSFFFPFFLSPAEGAGRGGEGSWIFLVSFSAYIAMLWSRMDGRRFALVELGSPCCVTDDRLGETGRKHAFCREGLCSCL